MPIQSAPSGLSRRSLLESAVFLVGGAAALTQLAACATTETVAEAPAAFFNPTQAALLDHVAETIIPTTDTPGACAAGVPAFIDSMMVNWASAPTRQRYVAALEAIDARARAQAGVAFAELDAARQLEVMRAHDSASMGDNGYRQLKQLVLIGYYHSEIGATQELHYELVPGRWLADAPLSEIGRTWA